MVDEVISLRSQTDVFLGALIPYDGGEKLVRVSLQIYYDSGFLTFQDRNTKSSATHKGS